LRRKRSFACRWTRRSNDGPSAGVASHRSTGCTPTCEKDETDQSAKTWAWSAQTQGSIFHLTYVGNCDFEKSQRVITCQPGRQIQPIGIFPLQIRCKWEMEIGRIWWELVEGLPSKQCSEPEHSLRLANRRTRPLCDPSAQRTSAWFYDSFFHSLRLANHPGPRGLLQIRCKWKTDHAFDAADRSLQVRQA